MKVNNKGMTLVELIITFALVLVMVVGLYNLILEVKSQMDEKQIAKDLTTFSATINNDIHYQLLSNKKTIDQIYVKSRDDSKCVTESCDSTITSSVNNICKGSLDCVIYHYKDQYRVIALNPVLSSGEKGILYGNADMSNPDSATAVFESIPIKNKYLMSDADGSGDEKAYVNYKNNNLIINYPLYLAEDSLNTHNYGFKIVVPFD